MPLPQVRSLRHDRAPRRHVRPRSEHHQREDLRVPVVLAHRAGRPHLPLPALRALRDHGAVHEEGHGGEEREGRYQGRKKREMVVT